MLISFTVGQFRSFGEEQTLNMVATSLADHPGHCVAVPATQKSVLRAGVIYGANASGKSNLVRAMAFAQDLVLGRKSLKGLALNRHRFTRDERPTSFEFQFLVDGRVFAYGCSLTRDAIQEEWLDVSSDTGRQVRVFSRSKNDIRIGGLRSFGERATPLRETLGALKRLGVGDDQLLMRKILELPDKHRGDVLTSAASWFTGRLVIILAESFFAPLVDLLRADEDFREFCGKFLKNVGTGIGELRVEEKKLDVDKVPKSLLEQLQAPEDQRSRTILAVPGASIELDAGDPAKIIRRDIGARHHVGGRDFQIAFQDESDGTQRFLNLLPALHSKGHAGQVFVVDEIDRSLHPLLTRAFLKFFLDVRLDESQQLIVTTHEIHLLDLELLRRDEVWFLEIDHQQQSRLTSLADWNVRKDLRIDKGYLQGRFGGIPFIGDTKKLVDLVHSRSKGAPREQKTTPS